MVSNGGFEQYSICPTSIGQITRTISWFSPSQGTPDFYHNCSFNTFASVPQNYFGHQYPRTGLGYGGGYILNGNSREYLETQLITPLVRNTCYYFEMYINCFGRAQYSTDDIGIYFSDSIVAGYSGNFRLPLSPQVNNPDGNYPDTLSWTKVSGHYIAHGGERYITIGNFKDINQTDTFLINSSYPSISVPVIYFYIDDVSLQVSTVAAPGMQPSAALSGSATLCSPAGTNLSVQINGLGPWDLIYSNGAQNFQVTGITSSPYLIPVNPAVNTTYQLMSVSNACAVSPQVSGIAQILKGFPHQTVLSGTDTYCTPGNPASIQLGFNGVAPWDITYSDGQNPYTISGITSATYSLAVSPTVNTTYSLLTSKSGPCTGTISGQATVQVKPRPAVNLGLPASVCQGDTALLSFSFTGTPPWHLDYSEGTQNLSVSGIPQSPYSLSLTPTATTNYSVLSLQDAYCSAMPIPTDSIVVHERPSAILQGSSTICEGNTADLSLSFTGASPWSIQYSNGVSADLITGISSTPYLLSVSPVSDQQYILTEVSDAYCTGTQFSGVGSVKVLRYPGAHMHGDTSICAGSAATLYFSLTGDSTWNLIYQEGSEIQTLSQISNASLQIPVSPSVTTTYRLLSVENTCGIISIGDEITLTVNALPKVEISAPSVICEGNPAEVTLALTGTPPWSVYTSLDSLSSLLEPIYTMEFPSEDSTEIRYAITRIKDIHCQEELLQTIQIPVAPMPDAGFIAQDSGLIVGFIPTNSGIYDSVSWDFGDGSFSGVWAPEHTYAKAGEYRVRFIKYLGACSEYRDTVLQIKDTYIDYLMVYGNPNNGHFRFALNYLEPGEQLDLAVVTRTGAVLYRENPIAEGFTLTRELNLEDKISAGIYFLRAITRNGIFSVKLIIL
ncbi:MAG: hypothetical protein EBS07_10625 [Sphingobacteriia bacterium]|nr:hypothetical protein [Sphingobacteriia bacterium]